MPSTSARKSENGKSNDRFVSLRKAALELEESRQTVLARIVRGELTSEQVAERTVVTKESVERVRQQKEKDSKK